MTDEWKDELIGRIAEAIENNPSHWEQLGWAVQAYLLTYDDEELLDEANEFNVEVPNG